MGYLTQKGFFDTIPNSMYEAARIDGASNLTVFITLLGEAARSAERGFIVAFALSFPHNDERAHRCASPWKRRRDECFIYVPFVCHSERKRRVSCRLCGGNKVEILRVAQDDKTVMRSRLTKS